MDKVNEQLNKKKMQILEKLDTLYLTDELQEEIKRENRNIESKINMQKSVKFALGSLKLKKIKKTLLTISLSASMIASGIMGAGIQKELSKNSDKTSSIYDTITPTEGLYNAPDEVIIEYVNSSFSDFNEYVNYGYQDVAQNWINAMQESYYNPVMRSYYDYKETNDDNYYKEFKNNALKYEERLIEYKESFSFDNSIYKYAKCIDGEVCVPYAGIISDSTLPQNSYVDNQIVYIKVSDLTKEQENSLKK